MRERGSKPHFYSRDGAPGRPLSGAWAPNDLKLIFCQRSHRLGARLHRLGAIPPPPRRQDSTAQAPSFQNFFFFFFAFHVLTIILNICPLQNFQILKNITKKNHSKVHNLKKLKTYIIYNLGVLHDRTKCHSSLYSRLGCYIATQNLLIKIVSIHKVQFLGF